MLMVAICICGMLLISIVSLIAATWCYDKELARDFMRVSWCAVIAAALYVGVLIIL